MVLECAIWERRARRWKEALIEMVQFMFEERAHKWDEWLKGGVMCSVVQEGGQERERELQRGCVACDGEQSVSESVCEEDEMVGGTFELDGWESVGI